MWTKDTIRVDESCIAPNAIAGMAERGYYHRCTSLSFLVTPFLFVLRLGVGLWLGSMSGARGARQVLRMEEVPWLALSTGWAMLMGLGLGLGVRVKVGLGLGLRLGTGYGTGYGAVRISMSRPIATHNECQGYRVRVEVRVRVRKL